MAQPQQKREAEASQKCAQLFKTRTVKAMEKGPRDWKVTVVFDGGDQRILYAAFAKLQKI